jgi:signal transduction histidine kinase
MLKNNKSASGFFLLYLFIDLILFIICLFGVHQIYLKAGIDLVLENDTGKVKIRQIGSSGNPYMREGDIILSLNGKSVDILEDIEFICDGLQIGDKVILNIQRNQQVFPIESVLTPYYNFRYIIIVLLFGSFQLFLGFYIIRKKRNDPSAIALHWSLFSTGMIIMNTWGCYNVFPHGIPIRIIFSIAYAFFPTAFVNLSLVFPRRKWKKRGIILLPFYIISAIFSILMAVKFIPAALSGSLIEFDKFLKIFDYSRIFFSISITYCVFNFIHSYRTISDESERRKLRWVFFGLSVSAISFISLWQIPEIISSEGLIGEDMVVILASFAPFTFFVSFIMYRILDIDLIINRSTVYSAVMAILFLIAIIITFILNTLLGYEINSSLIIISSIAIIIAAILAEPLRMKIQYLVNRYLFSVQFNYNEVQKQVIEEMKQSLRIKDLSDLIVKRLNNYIKPECVVFAEIKSFNPGISVLSAFNSEQINISSLYHDLFSMNSSNFFSVEEEIEPGIRFMKMEKSLSQNNNISLIFPVKSEQSSSKYYLILGKKRSNHRYALEDINLLTSITGELANTIDRIILQQKIMLEQEEAKRLEELNKLKTFFVTSVSHELKTPLTSIKMFSELLQDIDNLNAPVIKEYLEIIEGESDRLSRLIDNILDFSRMERGVKEYKPVKFSMNELLRKALLSLTYRFKMENCSPEIIYPDRELFIYADYDSIFESILNLIDNSIKYTKDDKKIKIKLSASDSQVYFSVEDNGIGIPKQDIDKIFQPFYRIKDEDTQQVGGSGLGLSLVKNIMDANNGKIEVSSIPGEGSKFSLIFQEIE